MEEGKKIIVYVHKDGKILISFKTNPYNYLNIIRDELIKNIKISNFLFFQKETSLLIEKENENEFLLCEILYNENNFEIKACKNINSGSNFDLNLILITVYLNNNVFYKGKISKNETLINFLKTLPNKIPDDSKLLLNGYETDINEVDQIEEILDNNNNIYFISSRQIRNIPKKEEEKEEIQSKEKIIIQFGKNTKIEKLNVSIKLNELRKILIKKNYGNFDFIYKYDDGEIILDRFSENDWKIEEIIVKKNNSKFIYLKVEDEKESFNNDNNNNNEILITFYSKNNNKLFEKKLNINLNLSEIRNIIKNEFVKIFYF